MWYFFLCFIHFQMSFRIYVKKTAVNLRLMTSPLSLSSVLTSPLSLSSNVVGVGHLHFPFLVFIVHSSSTCLNVILWVPQSYFLINVMSYICSYMFMLLVLINIFRKICMDTLHERNWISESGHFQVVSVYFISKEVFLQTH